MNVELIEKLGLEPHPGGGYSKRTYTAEQQFEFLGEPRAIGSAIYYYLDSNDFSAWHRVRSDEMWHHYSGSAVTLHMINEAGELSHITLGDPCDEHRVAQFNVPAGIWFAAELTCENAYALMGCTLMPSFMQGDFEMANAEKLSAEFPAHKDIIHRLSREAV